MIYNFKIPLILLGSFLISAIFDFEIKAEINTNSLINLFCIENVKAEMIKSNLNYEESFGKYTCECYLRNLSENRNHEDSISICKEMARKKFNL